MQLFIHVTNSAFQSCDEGAEYETPEAAMKAGVHGAVALVADEIYQGKGNTAAEISVRLGDGTSLLRSVISLSVAELLPGPPGAAYMVEEAPRQPARLTADS